MNLMCAKKVHVHWCASDNSLRWDVLMPDLRFYALRVSRFAVRAAASNCWFGWKSQLSNFNCTVQHFGLMVFLRTVKCHFGKKNVEHSFPCPPIFTFDWTSKWEIKNTKHVRLQKICIKEKALTRSFGSGQQRISRIGCCIKANSKFFLQLMRHTSPQGTYLSLHHLKSQWCNRERATLAGHCSYAPGIPLGPRHAACRPRGVPAQALLYHTDCSKSCNT
jgi:hypothetical protein